MRTPARGGRFADLPFALRSPETPPGDRIGISPSGRRKPHPATESAFRPPVAGNPTRRPNRPFALRSPETPPGDRIGLSPSGRRKPHPATFVRRYLALQVHEVLEHLVGGADHARV